MPRNKEKGKVNAIVKAGNTAMSAAANPFLAAGAGSGSSTFMRFQGQSGTYLYGSDDDELDHGTLLAADVANAKYSWSFWWDGEVLETFEVRVVDDPMSPDNEPDYLPDEYDDDMSMDEIRAKRKDRDSNFMDGWSVQGIVGLRRLDGDMEEFTLKLNNGVAMNSFKQLLLAYGRLFTQKGGKTPIIELDVRKYKSKIKSVGTRYAPSLKIVDWRDEAELAAGPTGADDEDSYDDGEENDIVEEPKDTRTEEPSQARRGAAGARRGRGGRNLG